MPAQVDSRDYDETGVDIVEALELGKPDINYLQLLYLILFYGIPVNPTTDCDASKDFNEKEISPVIVGNKLLSNKENYTEEDKHVITEKLVRNIKSALKTEVKPVLSKRAPQLSSPSKRAILRGTSRARRQLENVSYCFGQPGTRISDPIKNQIEADLELSEEYTTNGRSRPSLSSGGRNVVFLQCKLSTPGQSPAWSPCRVTADLQERNIQICSGRDENSISVNIELLLRVQVLTITYLLLVVRSRQ